MGRHRRPVPRSRERALRFDDRDRRRLLLASALTIAALPAVWLVNRDDKATLRPNVAAVGAGVDDAAAASSSTSVDPMGTVGAQYLDGTASPAGATDAVTPMVGTADGHVVARATAVFRRSVGGDHTCLYNGVAAGSRVTVVNVDNSRSMTCATSPRPPDQPPDELVMSATAFAAIADLGAAPIDVEIRLRP